MWNTLQIGVVAILFVLTSGPAWAAEGKKKIDGAQAPAGKPEKSDAVVNKPPQNAAKPAGASAGKDFTAAEAKEIGGDESELNALARELGLSDAQKAEVAQEFDRYRARQLEIKSLPEKSPNEKLLKGPQRRQLRKDLETWVKAHVSPSQAQRFDAYSSKRETELYAEQVHNRVAKLDETVALTPAQESDIRAVYQTRLREVHNAADALYAAPAAQRPALEKELEAKREALKSTVQGLLRPEQLEKYQNLEDS